MERRVKKEYSLTELVGGKKKKKKKEKEKTTEDEKNIDIAPEERGSTRPEKRRAEEDVPLHV